MIKAYDMEGRIVPGKNPDEVFLHAPKGIDIKIQFDFKNSETIN